MSETSTAVLLPTRGLVFGQTMSSVFNNLGERKGGFLIANGLPIPEAQNKLAEAALKTPHTHFWWVEEDVVIPPNTLNTMLGMDKDVVCVDYPVINGWSTIKKKDGEIRHCGLGCTLIKRQVFEKIPPPWFSIDKSLDAKTGKVLDIPMKYGGHDIFFGIKLREYKFKIHQLEGVECGHLRCEDINRREDNNGVYKIYSLPVISKWQDE